MTSPAEMIRKYETSPFTLYELRGKQFVILENMPISGQQIREKSEFNEKFKKDISYFYVAIEEGLFHKDLKMNETEMLTLFLNMPKGIQNLQGAIYEVAKDNKYGLTYRGTAQQDINGNKLGTNTQASIQSAPISQPQQPQDQKDLHLTKLVNSVRTLDELGNKIDAAYMMKICENISPGNALDLFQYAKTKGAIREDNGAWKVN